MMTLHVGKVAYGLAILAGICCTAPSAREDLDLAVQSPAFGHLKRLRLLSDAELGGEFDRLFAEYEQGRCSLEGQACLTVITERGGAPWVDRVRAAAQRLTGVRGICTSQILATLRRLERKTDPIVVVVELEERELLWPELPSLKVALKNVDELDVSIKKGGDYRTGRQLRWRVEARDAAGRLMPSARFYGSAFGGGMFALLPERGAIKTLRGAYAGEHADFIEPDSPAAALLMLGLKAVPELLDALLQPESTPKRRAWLLALLFGVTGAASPCDTGALGEYRCMFTLGAYTSSTGAGWSDASGWSEGDDPIDSVAQDRLIEEWRRWRDLVSTRN